LPPGGLRRHHAEHPAGDAAGIEQDVGSLGII
jgi:hypothetical protein